MEKLNTKISIMKNTINKIKSEISSIQNPNQYTLTNEEQADISAEKRNTSMKNIFKNSQIPRTKEFDATFKYDTPSRLTNANTIDNDFTRSSAYSTIYKSNQKKNCIYKRAYPMPIKLHSPESIGLIDQSKNNTNMFLNYTNHSLNKNTKRNSFVSCEIPYRKHIIDISTNNTNNTTNTSLSQNYQGILKDIAKLCGGSIDLRRLRASYEKAKYNEKNISNLCSIFKNSDLLLRQFEKNSNLTRVEYMKKWLKNVSQKKEYYEKEINLYKKLCMKLIHQSEISDLEEINTVLNRQISLKRLQEAFQNKIQSVLNDKYRNTLGFSRNNSDFSFYHNAGTFNKTYNNEALIDKIKFNTVKKHSKTSRICKDFQFNYN